MNFIFDINLSVLSMGENVVALIFAAIVFVVVPVVLAMIVFLAVLPRNPHHPIQNKSEEDKLA